MHHHVGVWKLWNALTNVLIVSVRPRLNAVKTVVLLNRGKLDLLLIDPFVYALLLMNCGVYYPKGRASEIVPLTKQRNATVTWIMQLTCSEQRSKLITLKHLETVLRVVLLIAIVYVCGGTVNI
jgi:hypothetical protein